MKKIIVNHPAIESTLAKLRNENTGTCEDGL